MNYPSTRKCDFTEMIGTYENKDPYQWLEDRHDPEVLAWVAEQNKHTDGWFEGKPVQELAAKLKARVPQVEYGVPVEKHGRIYIMRHDVSGKFIPVLMDQDRNEIATVGEELLDNINLFDMQPSPTNEKLVCFRGMLKGAHMGSVIVYNIESKEVLCQYDDIISFVWTEDGAMWYSQTLPNRAEGYNDNPVYRWTEDGENKLMYSAPRNRAFVTIDAAPDNSVMANSKFSFGQNELLHISKDGTVTSLTGELRASHVYCGSHDGKHYILTDNGASLGKIIEANGETIIPEGNRMITSAAVCSRGILVSFMEDVCSRLELYGFDGQLLECVELPDACGSMSDISAPAAGSHLVYFTFQSFTIAPSLYAWDERDGSVKKVYSAYSDVIPDDIVTTEVFVTARDGEKIPAFIVHKKDVQLNGDNPVLMYGYGGYNLAMTPSYRNGFIGLSGWEWVEKGGVYVNCNMRGGNEYGSHWHEAGMLKTKKNAFQDFIDIAEWMIANNWTKKGRIAICGGSNGGLLMTALTTMRPDLWGAVIASVPHTDIVRFMYDPAGPRYITEYGNPREADMLEYLLSYSPYHNVRAENYPPIYIQTCEPDNNVPPYHAKKFAAKMQEYTQGGPAVLRVLEEGGHSRGVGDTMYRTFAEMQLFIKEYLGI